MKIKPTDISRKPKQMITLSIDFIDQLEYFEEIDWEDILYVVKRMDNQINEPTTLGHVFSNDFVTVFIEFTIFIRSKKEYLFTSMETISSDRYLDLMLEGRIIKLSNEIMREIK